MRWPDITWNVDLFGDLNQELFLPGTPHQTLSIFTSPDEAVLSSAPSDKFPTLQAQEDCSLTIELELLNLTGTRWASQACTLLPMLELFAQLKSRGTSQMTWHHLKCRLIWWPQPGTISARDSTSDAFNFCISRSGCGRYIATQWFWAALHLRSSACVAEIWCEPRTALDLQPVMLPSCLLSFFFRPYESSRS